MSAIEATQAAEPRRPPAFDSRVVLVICGLPIAIYALLLPLLRGQNELPTAGLPGCALALLDARVVRGVGQNGLFAAGLLAGGYWGGYESLYGVLRAIGIGGAAAWAGGPAICAMPAVPIAWRVQGYARAMVPERPQVLAGLHSGRRVGGPGI